MDVSYSLKQTSRTRAVSYPAEGARAPWMAVWLLSDDSLNSLTLTGTLEEFDSLIATLQQYRDEHAAWLQANAGQS